MKDLRDPSHCIFKQSLTRLDDPKGICVDEKKRKFWSVVGLDIHGYKKVGPRYYDCEGFHGRMTMSESKYLMMANVKLDRGDCNCTKFERV
jgi:hypothetical protein